MAKTTRRYDCGPGCPVEATLDLIDGKWKGVVLYHLLDGCLRFNALRRKLPGVTQRVLTRQLRELETAGLVVRTVYAEVPPRVEYRLSGLGASLRPVILALKSWGDAYLAARDGRPVASPAPGRSEPGGGPLVSPDVPG
ncbi:helix-turn-helix domain-containing protein [Rhodoplanes sp. TEM]|uniref:Helix-turn-helix domain-containing protein n=1 Tax=Rhodoplanes tepidamans TaxID=200616 RepID=A0ABT5J7D0_RHOTP|nr:MULTISPECIES: helix-turn-helix domain-containing protein [Rhodoplanes]MDC7785498.1 helix-turn-helix domain-containing protein [Rhodoplanes tepidamans]MDC7986157.1 helix-turn-helix domain-containing protein [Rhodoplanes sp. TEM]MDQ0353332.1 DNA-binding HxlR family transcriptional regulator [Rhodoplanes tepidamans]